jgi:hypothetical protein
MHVLVGISEARVSYFIYRIAQKSDSEVGADRGVRTQDCTHEFTLLYKLIEKSDSER